MKPERNAPWSETGDYEHPPRSDRGVLILVIVLVAIAFFAITAWTEEPEAHAIEAIGSRIYALTN